MAAKGRGGGKTPDRVVDLLKMEVEKTSQAATARSTGLALQTVQNYIKGIGEPSQSTLEKLASYFYVTVPWLRGGAVGPAERLLECLKKSGVSEEIFREEMSYYSSDVGDNWIGLLRGEHHAGAIYAVCHKFNINYIGVSQGDYPLDFNHSGTQDEHEQVLLCAKCGNELTEYVEEVDERGFKIRQTGVTFVKPCETCCKGTHK